MERLQRLETSPNSFQSEINSRLKPKLNKGNSYGRKRHDNSESHRSQTTTGESTEVEDEDPEEDATGHEQSAGKCKEPKSYRKPLVCGICHLSPGVAGVTGVSASPGPMLTCTQGHLLCQQCVHRYTVCSDVGCVVCGADLYASTSTCYQVTSCANSHHPNLQSSLGNPRGAGVQAIANNPRALSHVQKSDHGKINWSRNYNEIPGSESADNGAIFYAENSRSTTGHSSVWDGDSGDAIRANRTDANSRLPQHQRRSYSSLKIGDAADLEAEGGQRIVNSAREGPGNAALVHAECSRRPIRCPRLDCAVNVAFSALTHHFLFDHPEVPILSVEPGTKSTLIVSFAALSCDSSRCLALLLVSGKLTGAATRLFNGSQIQPRYRNRLPLPVLAARLHCSNQNPCGDEAHAHGEGQDQGDVIIAWVAGLDVGVATAGTLRCSIQAVDGNDDGELRSLTYTGPVNSLRTAQRPREVFRTGDCVILHQGFIDHITSGCSSLNVNVIVH